MYLLFFCLAKDEWHINLDYDAVGDITFVAKTSDLQLAMTYPYKNKGGFCLLDNLQTGGKMYSWHQMYSTPSFFPIDFCSKQVVQH